MEGTWAYNDGRSHYTIEKDATGSLTYRQTLAEGNEASGNLRPAMISDSHAWMWEAELNNKARIRFRLDTGDVMTTSYRRSGTKEWGPPTKAVRGPDSQSKSVDQGQPQEGPQDLSPGSKGFGKGKGIGKGIGKGKAAGKASRSDPPVRRGRDKVPPPVVCPHSFSSSIRRLVLRAFIENVEDDPEDSVLSVAGGLRESLRRELLNANETQKSYFDVLPLLPISRMFSEEELEEHKLKRSRKKDPRQTIVAVPAIRAMPGLGHPLTFNEEQMLRLFVTDPRSMAYNLAMTQRSRVPLTAEQCELAHRIIVGRHEVLRSSFSFDDPKNPTRKVERDHRGGFYALAVTDQLSAEILAGMDYATPHQLGVCSIRLSYAPSKDNFGAMHVNMHHILADNDALMTFWEESFQIQELLYYGFSKEAVIERLPKLPVQFTDFAYWQKSLFSQGLLDADLAYWSNQITHSQPPMVLDIPIDRPRPRVWNAVGESLAIPLDQDLMTPVMELNPRASPFAVIVANFSLALMRMTGQRVTYMATAFALRSLPAVQHLIGNFLNMLPMRVSHDPAEPYMDVISRVATSAINVQRYNLAPFIQIVSDTQKHYKTNDPSRNPIYQTMVDVVPNENDSEEVGLKGVLDVFLFANTKQGHIWKIDAVFNTSVLTRQTVRMMLIHIKALTMWAAMNAKSAIPRMLPTFELGQEAADADCGIVLTHILHRGKGLPSVAAMQSGREALDISQEHRGLRTARRFKLNSGLEMGGDVTQALMKTAQMPRAIAPPAPRPKPPRATLAAPAASASSLVPPSSSVVAIPNGENRSAAVEPSVEEEVAARRAEVAKRRERSYNVAARWAETQRESELIPLDQEPLHESEAFPRLANQRPRGFAAFSSRRPAR